jgi:ketosteroid isomerase-like protein
LRVDRALTAGGAAAALIILTLLAGACGSDPGGDREPARESLAGARVDAATASRDSAAVAATVERYHRALADGDSTAALALLAEDAVVLESGGVETRAEYRSHHLPADMEFARAVRGERGAGRIVVRGDVAWASSSSTAQGDFRGRPVNSSGAELMVLSREPDGWRIRAIHWSSRTRR